MGTPSPHYWGKPTASIDWCEHNYVVTPYIAEFWNTISSLYFTAISFFGLYLAYKQKSETRLFLSYIGLGIVGIGSALFHATLLYTNQLADELPMIYGTLLFAYCVTEYPGTNKTLKVLLIPGMILYGVATTVVMLIHSDNPVLHQLAYAFLVFYLIFRSGYITYKLKPMSNIERNTFSFLYVTALVTYGAGYLSWITERKLCHDGRVLPYVQLHSMWHVFTGTGTFIWLQHTAYYRLWLQNRAQTAKVSYLLGIVPYVSIASKGSSRKLL
jgi:dihydroceramidase